MAEGTEAKSHGQEPVVETDEESKPNPDGTAIGGAEEAESADDEMLLKDLVIVSPKVSDASIVDRAVFLPLLQPSEPVQSLRSALTEVLGLAHLTKYRFELESARPKKLLKATKHQDVPLISEFSGEGAMTSLPLNGEGASILDDLSDLAKVNENCSVIRIVLETYDAGSVSDHIQRLRSLFAGNVPSIVQLHDPDAAEPAQTEEDASKQQQQKKKVPDLKAYDESNAVLDPKNVQDFFYLANGEDAADFVSSQQKKKKKRKEEIPRWNALEEETHVKCIIEYSGFHPPPPQRRLMGDVAYLCATMPDGTTENVTASRMGFYINKTRGTSFDPSPTTEYCYSHSLLDCLLQSSEALRNAWTRAIEASFEKAKLSGRTSHISSLFHTAIRGDFSGFSDAAAAFSATFQASCSWLVPVNKKYQTTSSWNHNDLHTFNHSRANEFQSFGVDMRSAAPRDWNEELQLARELPVTTFPERMERARVIYKIQHDFAEASVAAIQAIAEGHIESMNPAEAKASRIYLWNNIFVSTAHDGPDTFKTLTGDRAARKTASKDVQCIGTLQRMENTSLSTLATLIIDYLGTRYVCQSVLPGILVGERAHTLLYGAVDSTSPLKSDEDFRKIVHEKIGSVLKIASRPVLANPMRNQPGSESVAYFETSIPIEAKGIRGSDNRTYVLELSRVTPRDANWITKENGGTGNIEDLEHDNELSVSVLRSELVTRFVQTKLGERVAERKLAKASSENKGTDDENSVDQDASPSSGEQATKSDEEKALEQKALSDSDLEFLETLRPNVNVFIPNMRRFDDIDPKIAEQIKADEDFAREMAMFLWSKVLAQIIALVRSGSATQVFDGKSLCEFLHRQGVNCRYMGRLAQLSLAEEAKDDETETMLRQGKEVPYLRKTMPRWWLETLECEMISRSAKHVLNDYLTEKNGVASTQPIQTICSLLSALVSEYEESAAQTETRMDRRLNGEPDDDDINALTIAGVFQNTNAIVGQMRSRGEIWDDIVTDVSRRFRYTPMIFNNGQGKSPRANYPSLLRRVCQLTGVRLFAKHYDLGGGCVCGGSITAGGRLIPSYPISPLDVVEVIPLMKHSAAYSEGAKPCSFERSPSSIPPLQVFLSDARVALERAHLQANGRAANKALELAQEAGSLYTKVSDHAAHPGVIQSFELIATILLEYGDSVASIVQGSRVLSLAIQSEGFDSHITLGAHVSLAQMLMGAKEYDAAVKHLRAAIYITEMLSGPRHVELYSFYHKLGTIYASADYEKRYLESAMIFFTEARRRDCADRLLEGLMAKNMSRVLENLGDYKGALGIEKDAFHIVRSFLGPDHAITKESDASLARLTKMAVADAQSSRTDDFVAKKATKKKNGKKKK